MPEPDLYKTLAKSFDDKQKEFKAYQLTLKAPETYHNIAKLEHITTRLETFLAELADLHFQISIEAYRKNTAARSVVLTAIGIVMTKIEYNYLSPYNHRITNLTNRKNFLIAYIALFISFVGIGIALPPFFKTDPFADILSNEKNMKIEQHQIQTKLDQILKEQRKNDRHAAPPKTINTKP